MKRILLTLQSLLFVLYGLAQSEVVLTCNSEGELPTLLSEEIKQSAVKITVIGSVSKEDIKALNTCNALSSIDLMDAQLTVIPEHAWKDLKLQTVCLPRCIDTLNANAISLSELDSPVEILLPGKFPCVRNYSGLHALWNNYLHFSVVEGNKELLEDDLIIYSSDRKVLYKSVQYPTEEVYDYLEKKAEAWNRYISETSVLNSYMDDKLAYLSCTVGKTFPENLVDTFQVESVKDYAFSNITPAYIHIVFAEGLNEVSGNILEYVYDNSVVSRSNSWPIVVEFLDIVPPHVVGDFEENFGAKGYIVVLVPDKDAYINSDRRWDEKCWLYSRETYVSQMSVDDIYMDFNCVTPYYDLMGRPVANPTRGIYIKDGRKVVIGQ